MNGHDVSPAEHTTPAARNPSFSSAPEDYTSLKRSLSRLTNFCSRERGYRADNNDIRIPKPSGHGPQFHIDVSPVPAAAEMALAALQYLPTPVIVLGALKTVLVANEAMGRLLGLRDNVHREEFQNSEESTTEILKGQTLSQIGLDMLSDGIPIWVSWEKFLDNLSAGRSGEDDPPAGSPQLRALPEGELTLKPDRLEPRGKSRSPMREKSLIRDTVVDVVVSSQNLSHNHHPGNQKHHKPRSPGQQTHCRMIISLWWLNDQKFFTLTFTSATQVHKQHPHSHLVPRAASLVSKSSQSSHSQTPTSSRSSSVVTSPSEVSLTASAFPPTGAPPRALAPYATSTATDFQKVTRMKDAMLGAMHIPVIAMWRDESVVFPNQAARRLLEVDADPTSEESYDFLSRFKPHTADFESELEEADNPIIKLCRTQKAFTKWEIGLITGKTGKKSNYDVSGHPVFDDKTGEFLAGLIAFKDVTEYTERIASQNEENEQQFQLICDTMPQMLWTTRPDGYHDYFSQRWYDYTGLTPQESHGMGWKLPFYEDDMPETVRRWEHSMKTGDEYLTEYRCRRHDGQWRWMLGRALPLRDSKTGEIVKWFGSCTDIQDVVDARNARKRTREQLLDVLRHAEMTMWTTNRDSVVTFFEGDVVPGLGPEELKAQTIGKIVYDAFKGTSDAKFLARFRAAMQRILSGESKTEIYENGDADRWFRSRLIPLRGRRGPNGLVDESYIDGVVGISTDVTELKKKEQDNIKLLANETAAKEASKMKSNFLANMSHEIRTPIAGVLGMSDLLMDTKLNKEQSEFASNIHRSANSLLTVINDILDFSKIESGRLDMEEVQFSLGVVLRDVAKMLSFAADRKKLEFISDIKLGDDSEFVLLGDPGRIRQILTNLLTNSIKFTSNGHVKLSASILEDANDSTTVQFQVEDTGIGIEEVVKKRLFRPFSQADSSTARRFGGTGLGLTISKNLVDLMHGQISLESKLDQGTVATFTIPFKKPEYVSTSNSIVDISALPDRLQSEPSLSCNNSSRASTNHGGNRSLPVTTSGLTKPTEHNAHHNRLPETITSIGTASLNDEQRKQFHILVVEDNPVNQQIALKFIQSLKFSVSAVWNGQEALDYILKATENSISASDTAAQYPVPALILMDVQMPVLDGYHCTHKLRRHAPYKSIALIQKIPIVAMTASAIQGDREKCQRAGMDDYLAKPVKRGTLEKMILKWLTGESKMKHLMDPLVRGDGVDLDRPDFSRSGTAHSSNCTSTSVEVAPVGSGIQTPISPMNITIPVSTNVLSTAAQELADPASRRSSFSKTLLASELPGAESEGERGMRRVTAEEMAASLRDAKLIAATDPPPGQDLRNGYDGSIIPASTATELGRSYPEQGGSDHGISALTQANVEKLNADLVEDDPGSLSHYMITDSSVLSSFADAETASKNGGTWETLTAAGNLTPPVISLTTASLGTSTSKSVGWIPSKPRRDQLGIVRRQSSDWSSSTAKPQIMTDAKDEK